MKCLWYCGLALGVVATMFNSASGQSDWGRPSELGSYQSILSSYQTQGPQGSATRNLPPVGQPMHTQGQGAVQAPQQMLPPNVGIPNFGHGGAIQQGGQIVPNAPVYQGGPVAPSVPGHAPGPIAPSGSIQGGVTYGSAPCGTGGGCGTSAGCGGSIGAYSPVYGAPAYNYGSAAYNAAPAYSGTVYSGANCGAAPVYSPGSFGVAAAARRTNSANRTFGIRGLFFEREYEDNRRLSYNGNGEELFSRDADLGHMGGVETFLTSRNCNGNGWELRYWGLYPQQADVTLLGAPIYATTALTGLQWLTHGPSGANVQDIYNFANNHRLYRDNEITNVEFNLLKNGGCFTNRLGKQVNYELLSGFRWFQFDETLRYSAFGNFGGYPTDLNYEIDVENTLLGLQFGGRTETCLAQRWRLAFSTKVGIFNNHVTARQRMYDENGINPFINTGIYTNTPYDFESEQDRFSMLGELDLGLIYQFSGCARATIGYRALGISGVALAPDQIPYDFSNVREIERVNTNGDLILHGGYAGLEWCY